MDAIAILGILDDVKTWREPSSFHEFLAAGYFFTNATVSSTQQIVIARRQVDIWVIVIVQ